MFKRLTPFFLALIFIGQACFSNLNAAVSTRSVSKSVIHSEKTVLLLGQMDPAENEELDEDQHILFSPVIIQEFQYSNFPAVVTLNFCSDDRPVTHFRQPCREIICTFLI